MRVSLEDGTRIAAIDQVDDFLFINFPLINGFTKIVVEVSVPIDQNAGEHSSVRLSMTPPFFGGCDIAENTKACYSWGASLNYGLQLQTQSTRSQRFQINEPSYRQTNIQIETASTDQRNQIIEFHESKKSDLSLLVLQQGKSKHDFFYGPSTSISSTHNRGNTHSLDINVCDRFSNTN